MPDIVSISEGSHRGKEGFVVEWEMVGFSEEMAKFRAVGSTAMRFPTTIMEAEVIGVSKFGDRDFNIKVFVPTEGFPSAGVQNPMKWLREQFPSRILD